MNGRLLSLLLLVVALPFGIACYLFYGGQRLPNAQRPITPSSTAETVSNSTSRPNPGASPAPEATSPSPTEAPSSASAKASPPRPYLLGSADVPPAMDPDIVLSNMRIVLRNYGSMFGGNPVGTNPEITAALNGDNPKQARFINPESGLRINGNGELVDSWGTPSFFHQLSASDTEIRSAGPDKKMWTADDLVTK